MTEELVKLRFRDRYQNEFPDWESKKLGEIGEWAKSGKLAKKDLDIDGIYSALMYGELYTKYGTVIKEVISRTNTKSESISKGCIIMPTSGETSNDIARASVVLKNNVHLSGDLLVFKPSEKINDPIFLAYLLNTRKSKLHVSNLAQGNSVVHISRKTWDGLVSSFPNISEQTKIAGFLSAVDEKIDKQSELVELLELQKKGYAQKLFNGSLRFKKADGTDYDDWERKKLGELVSKGGSGGTPKTSKKEYYNGEFPFLSISDITKQGKYLKNTEKSLTADGVKNSGAWLVPKNSLIYAMYASVGKMCINKEPITTSQAMYSMSFKEEILLEFMYYSLTQFNERSLNKYLTKGTQNNINAKNLLLFKVFLPSLPEQDKIAGFLSSLDERIANECEKLAQLKAEKTAYLQRVLV